MNRITRKSPPADVAAAKSARPINHIDRRIGADPRPATSSFYGTVALATLVGMIMNFSAIDPPRAEF